MAAGRNLFGLSSQAKAKLVEKLSAAAASRIVSAAPARSDGNDDGRLNVAQLEANREIRMIEQAADYLGISDPFFRTHEAVFFF